MSVGDVASATNLTWNVLGLNMGLHGEKPATDRLQGRASPSLLHKPVS